MKRQTVKRIALILGTLLLLAIGAGTVFVASEWTDISRMRSHPTKSILDVAWYQPRESVPGVERPVPLPVAGGLAPDAFAEAVRVPNRRTPPPCWSSTRDVSPCSGNGTAYAKM